jgi:hypothetical protein
MHVGQHLGAHLGNLLGDVNGAVTATVSVQLADATLAATALSGASISATVNATFQDAVAASIAVVAVQAVVSAILAPATVASFAAVAVTAAVARTLDDAVLDGHAVVGGILTSVGTVLADARVSARATVQDVLAADLLEALTGAPYAVIPRITGPTPRSRYEYLFVAAKFRTRPNLWLVESALIFPGSEGSAERIDLITGARVYRVGFITLVRYPSDRRGPYLSLPGGKMRFLIDDPSHGIAAINEWGPV